MPNHSLKRFSVGRYGGRVDYGDEYTGVRYLCGVAPIAADDATNGGAHFLGIFEGSHQVGADVLRRVAPANGKNEDHVGFIHPTAAQPIRVARIPSLIIYSRGEFGNVVRRRVCFYLRDLAEIADGM